MFSSFLALIWWTCILLCKTQDKTLTINSKFVNGEILFTWTGDSSAQYLLRIKRDAIIEDIPWTNYDQRTYTVKNALFYGSVDFAVYSSPQIKVEKKVNVSKIKAKVGDSVKISWTVSYFPQSGAYTVYHTNRESRSIIPVDKDVLMSSQSKYSYTSRPYNSTNISFTVNNITLDDAGYYASGGKAADAWSGGGVFLIVLGKPEINGNRSILVGMNSNLTCSSNLSVAPDYYAKLVKMNYTWYENDTRPETGQILRLSVTKNRRYNRYTCTAKDNELESDRSEAVQISPLYEPDKLTITPQPPPDDRLTAKEGETIGPYNCSADCNPPCSITWKLKDTYGNVTEALVSGRHELCKQTVYRNMSLFRCVAKYGVNSKMKYNISLNIHYLDKPIVYNNEAHNPGRTIELRENETLLLSCFVESNPKPNIELSKNSKETRVTSILQKDNVTWLNHTFESLQCLDSGIYTCTGVSKVLNSTQTTSFGLNITCKTRVDETSVKTIYGSKSGHDVKVFVAVPSIANPPPQESSITWSGPTGNLQIQSTVSQRDVAYKHWINSSIPIKDQNHFGNYTLKYNGDDIFTVSVIAEDVPQTPLNFTGYSYTSGYIKLTWVSGFNGGQQQHFVLSKKEGSEWREVANVSDPGEGRFVNFDTGRLNIGRQYMFRLKSCNAINCSKESVYTDVIVKAQPKQSIIFDTKFVVGAAGAMIIFIFTIALLVYCLKRKTTKERQRNVQVEVEDHDQPDVVLYAAVDKSALKSNQSKVDVVEDIPEKTNGNDTLYATVEKGSKPETNRIPDKKADESKKKITNKKQEGATSTEAMGENAASRNVNQDGLIYIDVEFAKKSDNTENAKPKIHGEEDRTEYTFVDFSKKAPVVKEKPKTEEEK